MRGRFEIQTPETDQKITIQISWIRIISAFYEFEEIGLNKTLDYETPADIVYKFPQFYWSNVAPQIRTAIHYLNVTSSGRQWIANLYGNVFRAEREVNLSGPQK